MSHTKQKIPLLASRVATLPQAVSISLSGAHGPDLIFVFCRAIKAFEATTGAKLPPKELENAFALWWSTAQSQLPDDADFDEYKCEFLYAFEKTRAPLGSNPLQEAIRLAESSPMPPEAARYQSPRLKRLVAVCRQLQLMTGDSAFFLGVRDAAAIIGTNKPRTGAALLDGLVKGGILAVIQKGTPGGNRATRYRYNLS
jgi:hypothetical protein